MSKQTRLLLALPLLATLLCLFFWYLWQIAAGSRPGYQSEVLPDVKVFYAPAGDKSVSAFLTPPPPSLRGDESVPLALLFHNELSDPVNISSLNSSPNDCFLIDSATKEIVVPANGSLLDVLRLRWNHKGAESNCSERQSLSLSFAWTSSPTPAKATSSGQGALLKTDKDAPPVSRSGSYVLATTQIRLPRSSRVAWERFFHILGLLAGAILTPLVIAIATLLYQKSSAERESRRKVWEIIYPDIVKNIQTHYAPILRRLRSLRDTLRKLPDPPHGTTIDSFAEAVLLVRAEVRRFASARGGFLFRSKPAEELCGELMNAIWDKVLNLNDPGLQSLVELGVSKGEVLDHLPLPTMMSKAFGDYRDGLSVKLRTQDRKDLDSLLTLSITILQLEIDHPFYPEWYNAKSSFDPKPLEECLIDKNAGAYLLERVPIGENVATTRHYARQYLRETRRWARAE